jgi:hypothetical protein
MPLIRAIDFINEANDRLGWPQLDSLDIAKESWTSKQRKLVALVNRVLKTMGGLNDWPLLRKDGSIVLIADEISATTSGSEEYVTATQNSSTVTIANVTLDNTYIGRAFQVSGDDYVYRILEVPTTTTIKIGIGDTERGWISDSITVSDEKTYKIGADRYALPTDFDRFTDDIHNYFSPYSIEPVVPREFAKRRRDGTGIEVDDPQVFTIYGLNDGESSQIILFDPFPDEARLLTFSYQRVHPDLNGDNDKILYAERYLEVLMDVVLEVANRDHEDDSKVQQLLVDAITKYNQQLGNPSVNDETPVIRPARNIRKAIRRKYGGGAYRWDYGEYFDRDVV